MNFPNILMVTKNQGSYAVWKSMENRPYQICTNVSDLHVSWSKVAVGLIIHKNDKKSWTNCLTPPLWAFPWKQPKN